MGNAVICESQWATKVISIDLRVRNPYTNNRCLGHSSLINQTRPSNPEFHHISVEFISREEQIMTGPLDGIMAIHNAFRRDMQIIDTAALQAAGGKKDQDATIERFRFFNDVLVWHATGEEKAIFPLLETVAPLVAEAYVMDHHGLDAAFEAMNAAYEARDRLQTARSAAAFKFHLDLHLKKEEKHLYRLFGERVPIPDQGRAAGQMASHVPQERFPEVVMWMFPLIGQDDRENMTRNLQMVLPAPAFGGVKQLIRQAIGDDWAELTRRIPSLLDA